MIVGRLGQRPHQRPLRRPTRLNPRAHPLHRPRERHGRVPRCWGRRERGLSGRLQCVAYGEQHGGGGQEADGEGSPFHGLHEKHGPLHECLKDPAAPLSQCGQRGRRHLGGGREHHLPKQ
jgi:hypothetical protein